MPLLWEQVERLARKLSSGYAAVASRRKMNGGKCVFSDFEDIFNDFYQCGYIALTDAVKTYNASCGKFSSWFCLYFKGEVLKYQGITYRKASEGEYKAVRTNALDNCTSLNAPITDDDGNEIEMGDLIADTFDAIEDADKRIFNEQLRATINAALAEIPENEADAVRSNYLDGKTLSARADELGVSASLVQQRKVKGLRMLARSKKLRDFYYSNSDIAAAGMRGVGVRTFNNTGLSATERAALRMLGGQIL